jgi:hypothetical protein
MTSRSLKLLASLFLALAALGCPQPREHVYRCTPGERIDVACGQLELGSCTGSGRIRICDGALTGAGPCTGAESLVLGGGSFGCPLATTYCPESGAFSVATENGSSFGEFTCNWEARRTPIQSARVASFACTPGVAVRASCGCGIGRYCSGDPTMTVCLGTMASCPRDAAAMYDDDECGNCPLVEAICPTSGSVTFETTALSSGSAFSCEFQAVDANWVPLSRIGV